MSTCQKELSRACIQVAAALSIAAAPICRAQLEEVIVTAQKREESLQDVPIAMTAFDTEMLQAKQITNVADVRFAAPNVSYTKANFAGNNFKIRGIGSDLVAAGSDAGVGIHINEVPLQAPRLFETEYYDIEQLAILRGPQGTLYGRNSTGGAVNMITARANPEEFEGYLEGQYGDYDHTKIEGAVNVPLSDELALRFAGISLQRDGYIDNLFTGNDIDNRDQWSVRGSLQWFAGENTTVNLMASYMEEDSSRTRSQKQLCHNDPSGLLGCLPDRLAFETVNPLAQLTGLIPSRLDVLAIQPALTNNQSENPRDLRAIRADFDPIYESDETLVTLRLDHEFSDYTFTAIAAYQDTLVRSQQDYNNNVSEVEFTPSAFLPFVTPVAFEAFYADGTLPISRPTKTSTGIIGGNIASSGNGLDGYDESFDEVEQKSLEMRVASSFDGPFNFLLGGFYFNSETVNDYWVISNGLDYFAVVFPEIPVALGGLGAPGFGWVSPSFRNRTDLYELESKAAFGEVYYQLNEELKLTLGLRYTVDTKDIVDRQLLYNSDANGVPILQAFGDDTPVPVPARDTDEEWNEWTGRLVLDWTPTLDWTDSSLVYASYSRGYKGGGFNPPFDPNLFPGQQGTYEPEYVNAVEIGTKNQLLDNRLQANLTFFFYDYEGLQVSKIINRTSFNENTDAEIFGMESELLFAPTENWLLSASVAYLKTEIKDFTTVDTRDPTQGRSDLTLIKDNISASNCVVLFNGAPDPGVAQLNSCPDLAATLPAPYTVDAGVEISLDGNELQNSPEWTANLGAEYTWYLNSVSLSLRADYYWQDDMWGRNFNTAPIDKIDSWDIWNAQLVLRSSDDTWYLRAFVKNVTDEENIVGMYVSDPSSGLFTNVFLVEPRVYGVAVGYNF